MIKVAAETIEVLPKAGTEGRSLLHSKVLKVYTPIKTTITLIEDDSGRICIISTHFLNEFYGESNLFRSHVAEILKMPIADVLFFSSHNHTDTCLIKATSYSFGQPQYDFVCSESLLTDAGRELLRKLKAAAEGLSDKLVPVSLQWGKGKERRISYNRKGRRADGTTYFMRESDRLLLGKDFCGDIDDDAFVIAFFDKNNKPVCFLTQFSAHPATAYHPEFPIVHGDFPQIACDDLSADNGGVPVGFLQGCSGDLNSKGLLTRDPVDIKAANALRFGHYLGGTFIKITKSMTLSMRTDIAFCRDFVPLPFKKVPSESKLRKDINTVDDFLHRCEQGDEDTLYCLGLNPAPEMSPEYRAKLIHPHKLWAEWALKFHTENRLEDAPESIKVETDVIRIGDIGIVGMACEPLLGIGRLIKEQDFLPLVIPCGYLNDNAAAYIPDAPNNGDMDYQSSFYRYTTALLPYKNPAGDLLAKAALKMLRRLSKKGD